jgi:hypothetical protein
MKTEGMLYTAAYLETTLDHVTLLLWSRSLVYNVVLRSNTAQCMCKQIELASTNPRSYDLRVAVYSCNKVKQCLGAYVSFFNEAFVALFVALEADLILH